MKSLPIFSSAMVLFLPGIAMAQGAVAEAPEGAGVSSSATGSAHQLKGEQDKSERRILELEARLKALEDARGEDRGTTRVNSTNVSSKNRSAPNDVPSQDDSSKRNPGSAAAPLIENDSVDQVHGGAATFSRAERSAIIEDYIDEEFRNHTESRNQHLQHKEGLYEKKLEEILNGYVDLAGYFRAGYGRNDRGGPQVDFQAPGAMSKYRLGNEANNFGEVIFGKNIYIPGLFSKKRELRSSGEASGPIARIQFRAEFFNSYDDYSVGSNTSVALPEAWASIGNVIPSQPSAKFWAGNRFYRRQDVHVTDFFFWNMSGGGGGVEDIQVGRAKLAFAYIGGGARSGLSDIPEPNAENAAGFSKTSLDFRAYEMPFFGGEAEVGIIYSSAKSGLDSDGNEADDTRGVSLNFVHKISNFISDDGVNRFVVQYGTGAAKTFNSTFERISTKEGVFIRPDDPGSWRVRVMEDFTANINEHFSLGPVIAYQVTEFGNGQGRHQWFSAGARPIVHFNRFFNIALEGGLDWVKDRELETEGALYKLTLAPQVSLGNRFFSRPTIRAFATYSYWSDDFGGQVGGNDYVDRNSGFTSGVQMEAWF